MSYSRCGSFNRQRESDFTPERNQPAISDIDKVPFGFVFTWPSAETDTDYDQDCLVAQS